jgi:hypothetical protein
VRADGRFVTGLNVSATLVTPGGRALGPFPQALTGQGRSNRPDRQAGAQGPQ